jgi:hypothetical protein
LLDDVARKQPTASNKKDGGGAGIRGSAEGHGGDAEAEKLKKQSLFRTKSMPKKRTHAFHFPLQAVNSQRDTLESVRRSGNPNERDTYAWDNQTGSPAYDLESPTIPPPVAFARPRESLASEATSGRGSKRLTM